MRQFFIVCDKPVGACKVLCQNDHYVYIRIYLIAVYGFNAL